MSSIATSQIEKSFAIISRIFLCDHIEGCQLLFFFPHFTMKLPLEVPLLAKTMALRPYHSPNSAMLGSGVLSTEFLGCFGSRAFPIHCSCNNVDDIENGLDHIGSTEKSFAHNRH